HDGPLSPARLLGRIVAAWLFPVALTTAIPPALSCTAILEPSGDHEACSGARVVVVTWFVVPPVIGIVFSAAGAALVRKAIVWPFGLSAGSAVLPGLPKSRVRLPPVVRSVKKF